MVLAAVHPVLLGDEARCPDGGVARRRPGRSGIALVASWRCVASKEPMPRSNLAADVHAVEPRLLEQVVARFEALDLAQISPSPGRVPVATGRRRGGVELRKSSAIPASWAMRCRYGALVGLLIRSVLALNSSRRNATIAPPAISRAMPAMNRPWSACFCALMSLSMASTGVVVVQLTDSASPTLGVGPEIT